MVWVVPYARFLPLNFAAVESILSYRIPEEDEDYTLVEESSAMDVDLDPELTQLESNQVKECKVKSNLKLPPPPLFSRQAVPHIYKYVASLYYCSKTDSYTATRQTPLQWFPLLWTRRRVKRRSG